MRSLKCRSVESSEESQAKLRQRLRNMSDQELIKFGKSVRLLCGGRVGIMENPFEAQLAEARAEWRRRHPKRI
jgi:hypothetical protein